MPTNSPMSSYYYGVLTQFSEEELRSYAQIKRLFEWSQGDPAFKAHFETGMLSHEERQRLKTIGVEFEPEEIRLLWEEPDFLRQVEKQSGRAHFADFPQEDIQKLAPYPLLTLWFRFISRRIMLQRYVVPNSIFPVLRLPRLDAWRTRRIAAVKSELGFYGHSIDHSMLAFELSDGCSIGCWFCAFAARKLTQNFEYADNKQFFGDVLRQCVDLFGRDQSSRALLYYGTEPHDNPGYLKFMQDFTEITGYPSCTSTAVPTDAAWIRELLAFYRQGFHPWPRFSVLSKAMLFKIHELYSPEELRDVELLMQMREHPRPKVTGGRILKEESGLRSRQEGHYLDDIVPQGSIACISGFLVNMVNRTIQLVSPCYTNSRWPYGYRIFDETRFERDAVSFRKAVETLIDRNMPDSPRADQPVRFRDDLVFRSTDDGFDLISPNQVHHCQGKETYKPLGNLIAEGVYSFHELSRVSVERAHLNPTLATLLVEKLFQKGLLDEVYRV